MLSGAVAVSAARREKGDGSDGNGWPGYRSGDGNSCLDSCISSHLSVPAHPTTVTDDPAHYSAYSSAFVSICADGAPTATAAIEACLLDTCGDGASHTWDSSHATSMCSRFSACATATAGSGTDDGECNGWFGPGGHRGDDDYNGPGHHGPGNNHGPGYGGNGPWDRNGWGTKRPDGYYAVSPSGTCTEGMTTRTESVTAVYTENEAVVTSIGNEVQVGTIVKLEETGVAGTGSSGGNGSTTGVQVPSLTAVPTADAGKLAVALGGLLAVAVGVVAVL